MMNVAHVRQHGVKLAKRKSGGRTRHDGSKILCSIHVTESGHVLVETEDGEDLGSQRHNVSRVLGYLSRLWQG